MIFDLAGRTIPGTGGMTTCDIWNGDHDRLGRAFLDTKANRYSDLGLAKPAPKGLAGSVATADETADIASDASEARPAYPPNAQGHKDWVFELKSTPLWPCRRWRDQSGGAWLSQRGLRPQRVAS